MVKQAAVVPPTTNIHDALQRATLSERDRVALINANFKLHPAKKEVAEQICAKNGTTLSAFLRECVDGLIVDFAGPKAAKQLAGGT